MTTTLFNPLRHALVLAALSLKLIARDRRAFAFSLAFPLTFTFVFGALSRSPDSGGVTQFIPMLVALSIVTGSFFGQGMSVVVQRERGMLRRYRLTPIGSASLLIGTMLSGLAMLAITVSVQLALLHFVYNAPLKFAAAPFVLTAVVGAASMASLGLIIAAITSTMQEAQITFQMTFLASMFLSGIVVPLEMYGRTMQRVAAFLPPTHMMHTLRDALTGHFSVRHDGVPLLMLTLMAATAITIASRLFRWDKDDPLSRRAKLTAVLALIPVLLFGLWQQF
ncbi:MAG TPA: ABC transporter permease [Armatimonadota bacterium]|jgi:ABC-2 type transport system permease protein